jgi:hypothetical protein
MRSIFTWIVSAGSLLLGAAGVNAQQFTWSGGGANGNWSNSLNWSPSVPLSGGNSSYELIFGGVAQTSTLNDLGTMASPFSLNKLSLSSDATSGFTIAGGPLRFDGSGNQITINGGTNVRVNISSAVSFAADTTIDITANSTGSFVGRELALSGGISGAGNIIVTSSGSSNSGREIAIRGSNGTYSGTMTIQFGRVDLLGVNAISRDSKVVFSGGSGLTNFNGATDVGIGSLPVAAFNQQIGSLSSAVAGGALSIGDATRSSVIAVGFDNTNTTYNGTFVMNNAASQFIKMGTGTLNYVANNTSGMIGSFAIRDGILNLGNAINVANPNVTAGNTGSAGGFTTNTANNGNVIVYEGAELRQTVTGTGSNGRFANSGSITLNGGTVRIDGSGLGSNSNGYSDVVAGLNLGAGESLVQINTSTVRGSRISFTTLNQVVNTATIGFRSSNLGNSSLNTLGSGNVNFNTAPTSQLIGAGTTATNLGILPYGFANDDVTGASTSFVTYDSTTGSIRNLGNGEYANAFSPNGDNVSLAAPTDTLAASATTVNSLRLTAGGSVSTTNGPMTITSGAFLNNGGGDVTGSGAVNFGANGAATAYLTTNGNATFSAPINASNISKNGAGNLTLGGTVNLGAGGGTVAVNNGTLTLGGSTINNATAYQVSKGATLDVGANLTVGNSVTLRGAGTVQGAITVNSGGTIEASALGGSFVNTLNPGLYLLSSPGVLKTANQTWNAGGNYNWYFNSIQGGEYTQSFIDSTGSLDLNGLSAANRFNINLIALDLKNSALAVNNLVYDFISADKNSYSWTIANFAGGIQQNSVNLSGDITQYFNVTSYDGSSLFVSTTGTDLTLSFVFTPIPEPSTVLLLASLGLAGIHRVRRNRSRVSATAC